jgi:preprotein translocase subunit SecG
MSSFLLNTSIVLLILVCIIGVLVILMQRPSANAGMGAALGGGAAETVFGGDSANVLTKMTSILTLLLFVLSFGLYLAFISNERRTDSTLEKVVAPSAQEPPAPVPVNPVPAPVVDAKTPAAPATK